MADVIDYLLRKNCRYIEDLLPGLTPVDNDFRFDSGRFDIFACMPDVNVFYEITHILNDVSKQRINKLIEGSEWIKNYKGSSIIISSMSHPQYLAPLYNLIRLGGFISRYYVPEVLRL